MLDTEERGTAVERMNSKGQTDSMFLSLQSLRVTYYSVITHLFFAQTLKVTLRSERRGSSLLSPSYSPSILASP